MWIEYTSFQVGMALVVVDLKDKSGDFLTKTSKQPSNKKCSLNAEFLEGLGRGYIHE